ncbi:hypothetical protein ABZ816_00875 [Actinosynnema sp. NPDC047251]|uniref:Putative secreted protein n=1 Tax=Saccharothrix espanaensis (strain ATCC 51144 / DSM 44229 / JCM 9112 / NBRC 15066 / NRRL 15764) TaxID=1179773 RepID=K0JZS2_SACES|nr:hypothetical protein [Saccharothrix espanaensis]CCH30802.1 putative secreted protein [Saccharothrix espanaensis DSM 44229]
MRFNDIGRRAAIVVAAGTVATGLLGGSAMAAGDPAGEVEVLGNAPSCVKVWVTKGRITQTGHALNDCDKSLNLKIVWANGSDGECSTVPDGWELTSQVAKLPRRFDGASTC